jgi:hypothetical protein
MGDAGFEFATNEQNLSVDDGNGWRFMAELDQ